MVVPSRGGECKHCIILWLTLKVPDQSDIFMTVFKLPDLRCLIVQV
jgi:hypothetical protein